MEQTSICQVNSYNRDLLLGLLWQVVSKTGATSPGQVGAEYASLGGLGGAGGDGRTAWSMGPMRWRDDALERQLN